MNYKLLIINYKLSHEVLYQERAGTACRRFRPHLQPLDGAPPQWTGSDGRWFAYPYTSAKGGEIHLRYIFHRRGLTWIPANSCQIMPTPANTRQRRYGVSYLCIIRRRYAAWGSEVCRFTVQSYALKAPKLRTLRGKTAHIAGWSGVLPKSEI